MTHSFSRKKNVRKKLNAMALEFADKNVLIVDGELVHASDDAG
jgi:amidophosphoribosyltransferase